MGLTYIATATVIEPQPMDPPHDVEYHGYGDTMAEAYSDLMTMLGNLGLWAKGKPMVRNSKK